MPFRDVVKCVRPSFFNVAMLDETNKGCGSPCAHIMLVCFCAALPLAAEFGFANNAELWQYDAKYFAGLVERHLPAVELQVLDGNATFSGAADPEAAVPFARAVFPHELYSLFLDKNDALRSYVQDALIHGVLRWMHPAWGDVMDIHLATPTEFEVGEQVQVRHKLAWHNATVVAAEPATKLQKYKYALKYAGPNVTFATAKTSIGLPGETTDICVADSAVVLPELPTILPGQVWAGIYVCGQGDTQFTLELLTVAPGERPDERATTSVDDSTTVGSRLSVFSRTGIWQVGVVTEIVSAVPLEPVDSQAGPATETPTCSAPEGLLLRISYEGFAEEWDEWIPRNSVRFGRQGSTVTAQFNFTFQQVLTDNVTDCSGSFQLFGQLRGGHLVLDPRALGSKTEGWVNNPCDVSSIGLRGSLNSTVDSLMFDGKVHDHMEQCGVFASWLRPPAQLISDTMKTNINYILTSQGDHHRTIGSSSALQVLDCPSSQCDLRTRPSLIRRQPAVVFATDEYMSNESAWLSLQSAVTVTPTTIYFFEGYSHHYGAYWRYEGESEDNDGQPGYPLTEKALRKHPPAWLYIHVMCETHEKISGQRRVAGSPTLNLHCTPEIASVRVTLSRFALDLSFLRAICRRMNH